MYLLQKGAVIITAILLGYAGIIMQKHTKEESPESNCAFGKTQKNTLIEKDNFFSKKTKMEFGIKIVTCWKSSDWEIKAFDGEAKK